MGDEHQGALRNTQVDKISSYSSRRQASEKNTLISVEKHGRYQLTAPTTATIKQVEQEVATARQQQQQTRDQRQRQRPRHQ